MRHLDLFAGIGGFSLAARTVGWHTRAWVEINPFCQKVLTKNFPDARGHEDIKKFDGAQYKGSIDIITGGFPCQPYSKSGFRKGTEDPRHLWPEMLRVIREVKPRWIVGENVRGIVDWSDGLVFETVQVEMENSGYEVSTVILPAAGLSAPHIRERVWFIAHANSIGVHGDQGLLYNQKWNYTGNIEGWQKFSSESVGDGKNGTPTWRSGRWPTKSGICRGNVRVPHRMDRIKALGNAIVPQVAIQIFTAINEYEKITA